MNQATATEIPKTEIPKIANKTPMDHLRTVAEGISNHKILSTFVAILIFVGLVTARIVVKASAGQLSTPIIKGQIVDAVYGIGTVTANRRLSFNPLIGNTVRHTYVKEGDKLKKGQPIIETDDGSIHYAPFDGVVNYFPYRVGENAFTTTPMIVFTDMTDRYIVVSMEQQGALRVKVGQDAKLSFDSQRQYNYEGKVSAVYSYGGQFLARIDSVNMPDYVLPDMTCDVAIVISVHKDALLIPIVAFDNGQVWVKRGKALPHAIPIKLGVVDSSMAEVVSGDLKPQDQVMIRKQVSQ